MKLDNTLVMKKQPSMLMHDFMCKNCKDIHYEVLRRRVSYFKETEGGIQEMCEIFDKIRNNGEEEGIEEGILIGIDKGRLDDIQKLISKKKMTFEEVVNLLEIPIEKQQEFRNHIIL